MLGQHFRDHAAASTDVFGPLEGGERVMWRGRCGVAEYAFEQAASLPRWTLPETTEVLVTDRRVLYAQASDGPDRQVTSGELRWLWPQHLRVQPGARSSDRGAAASQVQLVCGSADGSFPALVFAGGELATVGDADRMANLIRQGIARFRIDHADKLGLTIPQARILSRLLIGPEFSNHQGGEGQTVSLHGALPVSRPVPADAVPAPPSPPVAEGTRVMNLRPGIQADAARAWQAARAEEAALHTQPEVASRASELAARIADLVSSEPEPFATAQPDAARLEVPTMNLAERAEAVRRSAARFSANSAGSRASDRRTRDRETGVTTQGNRHG